MAAVKTEAATKLILKVETGTTTAGAAVYSQRSFGDINPELGTQDAYAVAAALAALQNYPLGSIVRQDTAVLTEEG